jgi:hypothetical protein
MSQSSVTPDEELVPASSATTGAADEAATEEPVGWLTRFRARRQGREDFRKGFERLRIRPSRLSSLPIAVLATMLVIARGGPNTARNIELRCEACNLKKGAARI